MLKKVLACGSLHILNIERETVCNGSVRDCLVLVLGVTALTLMLSACVVYEPYYYQQSQYDRVWESAIRAAEEVGIVVSAAERDKGTITGSKGPVDVTTAVLTQADGRIRVHLSARGPQGVEPYLTDRFNQAYQRYMGR